MRRCIFGWLKISFLKRCKEEEKCEHFSGTNILNRFSSNVFGSYVKFCRYMARGHKIYKFGTNWLSS